MIHRIKYKFYLLYLLPYC